MSDEADKPEVNEVWIGGKRKQQERIDDDDKKLLDARMLLSDAVREYRILKGEIDAED